MAQKRHLTVRSNGSLIVLGPNSGAIVGPSGTLTAKNANRSLFPGYAPQKHFRRSSRVFAASPFLTCSTETHA
jgi:hypothetical protein